MRLSLTSSETTCYPIPCSGTFLGALLRDLKIGADVLNNLVLQDKLDVESEAVQHLSRVFENIGKEVGRLQSKPAIFPGPVVEKEFFSVLEIICGGSKHLIAFVDKYREIWNEKKKKILSTTGQTRGRHSWHDFLRNRASTYLDDENVGSVQLIPPAGYKILLRWNEDNRKKRKVYNLVSLIKSDCLLHLHTLMLNLEVEMFHILG